MKATFDISERNEGTDCPWWLILDPRQNMRADIHELAGMITGPFFSREAAEANMKARGHHFSKRAHVYCMSGVDSGEYREAYRLVRVRRVRGRA